MVKELWECGELYLLPVILVVTLGRWMIEKSGWVGVFLLFPVCGPLLLISIWPTGILLVFTLFIHWPWLVYKASRIS